MQCNACSAPRDLVVSEYPSTNARRREFGRDSNLKCHFIYAECPEHSYRIHWAPMVTLIKTAFERCQDKERQYLETDLV
jgi:hypothetical protein